jgi:hypothetical protein
MKPPSDALDPLSRATLYRFGLTILTILGVTLISDNHQKALVALAEIAAVSSAIIGTATRATLTDFHLNQWDETAAYIGLYSLGRFGTAALP